MTSSWIGTFGSRSGSNELFRFSLYRRRFHVTSKNPLPWQRHCAHI